VATFDHLALATIVKANALSWEEMRAAPDEVSSKALAADTDDTPLGPTGNAVVSISPSLA
jgi:hypothetical protein